MSTIEILRKARELVARPDGWCQKALHNYTILGDYAQSCADGALRRACPRGKYSDRECAALLRKVIGGSIVDFNDAPGRTQAEVVAAFIWGERAEEILKRCDRETHIHFMDFKTKEGLHLTIEQASRFGIAPTTGGER